MAFLVWLGGFLFVWVVRFDIRDGSARRGAKDGREVRLSKARTGKIPRRMHVEDSNYLL